MRLRVKLPCQMVQALRIGGQAVGRVYISYTEERDFIDEESALLGDIVRRVSGYIESRRLFEETRIRAEELAVLNELGWALTARLSVEQVLEEVYRQTSRLVDTTNFYTALYDPDKEEITFPFVVDSAWDDWTPIKKGEGLTSWVIETEKPLLLPTGASGFYREDEGGIPYEETGVPALSWLGVPLMIGNRVLGVMTVQSYTAPHTYDEHDRDLLMAIASTTAIALQNARLFEQTQTRAERERVIREISDQMQRAVDMETLMRITAEELNRALGGSRAYVRLGTEAEREAP